MCEAGSTEAQIRNELNDGGPPAKRPTPAIRLDAGFKWNLQALANAADAVESGGKSPVSALNELGVRVSYTVLQQGGPAHCPSFTVAVTVADMTFEGWGHSKREARAAAARVCLAALLARAGRLLPAPPRHQDFTSDEPPKGITTEYQNLEVQTKPQGATNKPVENSASLSPATMLFGAATSVPSHKSPINSLYENYPGINFTCTYGDGSPLDASEAPFQLSHSMRFKVVCQIKDQKFEGYGSSKKLAKLAAARAALGELGEPRCSPQQPAPGTPLPQLLADHVARLVNEKFNQLMRGNLMHSKRKVLAGIVMTINHRVEGAKVIAVTTGTKCVSGEHMSVRGMAVNDCHAEVAARRCLQRHLYAQLLMYAEAPDPRKPIPQSDLEPLPSGGYQLRADRQLHMYVSTAPCGDGRIFSPHEHSEAEPDKHPNRLARGQLRTKIESGEGTIPVKNCNNFMQTWDGVLQGERLLTMSCSDKAARWCVVGLQGALLALLLRPVYLHSLVLGSLLHPQHMYRAICGRIENYITSLPPPFRLERPMLARAASTEARTPARAPSFSVCWSCTSPVPEVVNATTGKLESGQPSLLCKQSMFARWQYLVTRLPLLPQEIEPGQTMNTVPSDLDNLPYNEAKQLCTTYQVAKVCLMQAFEKASLGRWIKKPIEQDHFVCDITNPDPNALFAWTGNNLRERNTVQVGTPQLNEFGDISVNNNAKRRDFFEIDEIENVESSVAVNFEGSNNFDKFTLKNDGGEIVSKNFERRDVFNNAASQICEIDYNRKNYDIYSITEDRRVEKHTSLNINSKFSETYINAIPKDMIGCPSYVENKVHEEKELCFSRSVQKVNCGHDINNDSAKPHFEPSRPFAIPLNSSDKRRTFDTTTEINMPSRLVEVNDKNYVENSSFRDQNRKSNYENIDVDDTRIGTNFNIPEVINIGISKYENSRSDFFFETAKEKKTFTEKNNLKINPINTISVLNKEKDGEKFEINEKNLERRYDKVSNVDMDNLARSLGILTMKDESDKKSKGSNNKIDTKTRLNLDRFARTQTLKLAKKESDKSYFINNIDGPNKLETRNYYDISLDCNSNYTDIDNFYATFGLGNDFNNNEEVSLERDGNSTLNTNFNITISTSNVTRDVNNYKIKSGNVFYNTSAKTKKNIEKTEPIYPGVINGVEIPNNGPSSFLRRKLDIYEKIKSREIT